MRREVYRKKRLLFWLLLVLLALLSCVAVVVFGGYKTMAPTQIEYSVNIAEPKIQSISSNMLFLGNIYWGRYINDWSMASDLKYAYPFSRLNEFNRDNYDAWITTLECPSIYGVDVSSAEEDATLTFNCKPDYLPEAAKWFDIFSLANNHTDNQGADGFEETRTNLETNGIQYFGSYSTENVDDTCEVVSISTKVFYDDSKIEDGKLPIALCGYQGVFGIPTSDSINEITKYSEYLPTFAMPHMGAEYVAEPDEIKTATYHAMIDAGADMVIGDHPHTIQTTEVYNGKPIIYSMGNFIFDQQGVMELTRSAGINVLIEVSDADSTVIKQWLQIGESCEAFKDDCLDQIKAANLSKLNLTYSLGIVGSNDDGKIVKPSTEAELNSILDRLNWSQTLQDLRSPYKGI